MKTFHKRSKYVCCLVLYATVLCAALSGCGAFSGTGSFSETASEKVGEVPAKAKEPAVEPALPKASATFENTAPQRLSSAAHLPERQSETPIPGRYDSREHGKVAPVRDQGDLGTCWAFASLAALESRLLPGEAWDFSEDHMTHDPYFLLGQSGGGEYTMAMAYLLSWRGPVAEADDPYGDGVSPAGLKAVKHVQEIQILPDGDMAAVKRAIMEYGSVETSIYMDLKSADDRSDSYNPDTAAYCCLTEHAPNHDITLVGWDDDFPREAFTSTPPTDGAYLCENNWGEEFGEGGFFYVSYADCTVGADNVVYPVVEPVSNYSAIFQCDACGWIGQMGYGEEEAWAANIYRAEEPCALAAAGFYAIDQDTSYEIYVARGMPEEPQSEDFANRTKVAEGKLQNAGFYTITFDRTVPLAAGERFAVEMHLITPGAIHPIAIEYDAGDGKCVITLNGESYASYTGDFWENTQTSQECNICLKAYAR